ncbi:hypothetical protein KBZ10_27775 [Streptomyces sp. F63]|uniref:hypothetical protein n=1 Tax=Streptomyces sp. F63 TaxID=2824887 RepID=UPI001B373971|nr:hypothetical protein [Streptomyces sp. F63]MBQ0988241.1 hypothetical protein [Streptomyces sp. F63]
MATTEELRKTIQESTPFYAAVGTADLAAEKLREFPALIEKLRAEAPERFAAVRTADPKAVQEKVSRQAKEAQATVQSKLTEVFGTLDSDIRKLRDNAQHLALQGVGRAAEYAVKARETYDELADRGRGAVQNWRGEAAEQMTDIAITVEPEPEPAAKPATEKKVTAATEAKPAPAAKPATGAKPAAEAKPAAAKKPAAARKAPARKTTPKSAE